MHKVASKSCMNMLAIFKALGKAKKIFCKYCSKAEPKFGLHQDRRKHLSLQKSCQKSRKMNFCHQNPTQSCHCYRNPKLHSIASSIRNERNLLPYWSGSAVLKISRLRKEDSGNHARSELKVKLELYQASKLIL